MLWKFRNYADGFFEILDVYRSYIIFLVLIILALILLQTNVNSQLSFIRRGISFVALEVGARLQTARPRRQTSDAVRRLEERTMDLAKRNIALEDAYLENIALRHMLKFRDRFPLHTVFAHVVMRSPVPTRSTLTLNKGLNDGIRLHQSVITDRGLVGQIIEVAEDYAVCEAMLDQNFRVAAKIQRTRLNGIVHWQGESNEVGFYGVLKNLDVRVGDVILTSEYSRYFLPNFRIGLVTNINNEIAGIFKDIRVRTAVDFTTLENVFVVTDTLPSLSGAREFEKNFTAND